MLTAMAYSPAMTRSTSVRALPEPKLTILCSLSFAKYARAFSSPQAVRRLVMNSGVPVALAIRHATLPFHCGSSRS